MLQSRSLCLLLALSAVSPLVHAQDAGTATTTPAPTTTRSTLESLVSLGQAGLSYLGGMLNPTTQASTPTSSAVATTSSTSSSETTSSTSSSASTTQTSSGSRTTNAASSTSSSASLASARSSSSTSATAIFNSALDPTATAKAASTSNDPAKDHTSRTLAIALGVVGGVLLLAILAFALWFCARRRRRRERPDSALSDSDYGEKSIAQHGASTGLTSDRTATHDRTSYSDHGAVSGPAAAVTRKPVPQRSSWSRRSHPPAQNDRSSRDPFADQSNSWYDGGHHAYPAISPLQQPHQRSSWTPPAYVPPVDTSYSNAYPDADAPLVPRVSPLEEDSYSEDDAADEHGEEVFVAMGDSRRQHQQHAQQQHRQSQHLPPVREEEPAIVPLSPSRSAGEPQKPFSPRRYSGGSAWVPPSGSLVRPRSTPLSPLAQHPMMPGSGGRGGLGEAPQQQQQQPGHIAGMYDAGSVGRAITRDEGRAHERRSLME